MKYKVIMAALAGLALSGCENTEDKLRDGLVKYSQLYDPGSAIFRDIKDVGGGSYCLEINAKNRFGAYSGWRKAYLTYEKGKGNFNIILEPVRGIANNEEIDAAEKGLLNILCGYQL